LVDRVRRVPALPPCLASPDYPLIICGLPDYKIHVPPTPSRNAGPRGPAECWRAPIRSPCASCGGLSPSTAGVGPFLPGPPSPGRDANRHRAIAAGMVWVAGRLRESAATLEYAWWARPSRAARTILVFGSGPANPFSWRIVANLPPRRGLERFFPFRKVHRLHIANMGRSRSLDCGPIPGPEPESRVVW